MNDRYEHFLGTASDLCLAAELGRLEVELLTMDGDRVRGTPGVVVAPPGDHSPNGSDSAHRFRVNDRIVALDEIVACTIHPPAGPWQFWVQWLASQPEIRDRYHQTRIEAREASERASTRARAAHERRMAARERADELQRAPSHKSEQARKRAIRAQRDADRSAAHADDAHRRAAATRQRAV